jgi:chromosome segregation ATPase
LIAELKKTLFGEEAARSAADWALAEEKAARQSIEQSLLSSNEANTLLTKELDSTQASLSATNDKLSSKSSALDHLVIREQQMKIRLKACEERLTVADDKLKADEEEMKSQGQLLNSAQQVLSKWELLSLVVISSVVANAMVLMKNHMSNLDMEILRKDFTVYDAKRETLVNNAYDATHDFVSSYDFSSLVESDDNNSSSAL